MSEDCKVCKNIERFYSTNKGRGRGGGRKTKVVNKTVEPENIYIVICNNDVLRYTFSRKDAVTYMKDLVSFQRIQYNPDYITHVEQCGDYMRIVGENRFYEIYISTSLSECEKRDVKGLYSRARNGEIKNFTGISSPYQPPEDPFLEINTEKISVESAVKEILKKIKQKIK